MEENKKGIVSILTCLIFGLIGAGCITGIIFLCKLCYSMIYGGPLW